MGEPVIKIVETNEVENKALDIVSQANAVQVTSTETYTAAGMLWKSIGDMIKEVKDTFDPICDAAHKAHKAATEKRAKYLDPLTNAQKSVKSLMSSYDAEQERIRREEQRRLKEEARKQEEERLLQEALAAEEDAKRNGATNEEAEAEAAAIIEQPVYVAPVVVPKATPKLQGGPVYQIRWYAEVTDLCALCLAVGQKKVSTEYVMGLEKDKLSGKISSPALNKMAVALKQTLAIPGVKAYDKRV